MLALGLPLSLAATGDNDVQALQSKAQRAEAQGYHDLAAHYYFHAHQAQPSNADFLRGYAKAVQAAGHFGLAEQAWSDLLELQGGDAEATQALAKLRDPEERRKLEAESDGPQPEIPKKSDQPLDKGLGAWVFGEARSQAAIINQYNLSAPQAQHFKYVFPLSGTLSFHNGQAVLEWKPESALILADVLAGDARVYPLIQGPSRGASDIRAAEWERVAADIAAKLNSQDRYSGLMFDMDPEVPALHNLYARVKNHTGKPVGAAVKVWAPAAFNFTDFLVLKAFDVATKPEDYASGLRDRVTAFIRDAQTNNGKAMIGLPAVATAREYESTAPTLDGAKQDSGFHMDDYVASGRRVLGEKVAQDDPVYLGICLWAFAAPGGQHLGQAWYFPTDIDAKIFSLLQLPLVHP
jgi:hypothetical protein